MAKPISHLRRSYTKAFLSEDIAAGNPFDQFNNWFGQNLKTDKHEPTAVILATSNKVGRPSARVVLLKDFDEISGFLFFTNYESRKGHELKSNPYASLLFYWPLLERQIRIEGKVKKVSKEISEKYFQARPRASQFGAWASEQSSVIPHRLFLENTLSNLKKYFSDEDPLPLPPFWGGYTLQPTYFEFWQGRQDRLHDRIIYKYSRKKWLMERLAP
ncbi:MAG: pyridoxamine 5'-phosphate oxidase [Saprospiraceae bacterium]